jgi:hypothetical protein
MSDKADDSGYRSEALRQLKQSVAQHIWGCVNMSVHGTGRDLLSFSAIPLYDTLPEMEPVKLMRVLGQTDDVGEAKKLYETNLEGEFLPRTLPQEKIVEGAQ